MRRRSTPVTICALVLATACVARGASAQDAPHTVRLWHAYDQDEESGLREAALAFERSDAGRGVHVELLHVAFAAYAAKLESAIPAGEGPDVFLDAHERLGTYLEQHLVAPLPPPDLATRLDFDAADLDALSSQGRLYGLPLALKCAALYVNDALLREPPRTLEDVLAVHVPGGYPLAFEDENAYYVAALLHAYGGELLDSDGYAFRGPAAERTVARLVEWTRAGELPEEPSGDLVKRLFVAGRAAAVIDGPWLAPKLPPSLRWHVVPLPRVRDAADGAMVPFATIEGAFLARGGHEPRAALALARFLAGPEGARPRGHIGRQIVASLSAWSAPELRDDRTLAAFRQAAAHARPMSTDPRMRLVFEPAQRALEAALRTGIAPRDALALGARRFADVTRPPPPTASPTLALAVASLSLLLLALLAVRRAREPAMRVALRKSLPAYAWVAHAALAVGLLVVLPLAVGALASFFTGGPSELRYVGLWNYADILTARGGSLLATGSFWLVLCVTVLWTVANVTLHVAIGVALALLLHRPGLRLRGAYRVLLVLPWAVPSYVTALAWRGMFHRQLGAVNAVLAALGAPPVGWFAHFSTAFAANVATNVWLGFPFMMVVTLGALSAIPDELHEAAQVDGASPWQRFRLVTWPLLRPALVPAVTMGAVWTFNMFNVVFLVSGGEPGGSTEILVSEAYRWAFTRGQQIGYAAAYAVLVFGVLWLSQRALTTRKAEAA